VASAVMPHFKYQYHRILTADNQDIVFCTAPRKLWQTIGKALGRGYMPADNLTNFIASLPRKWLM